MTTRDLAVFQKTLREKSGIILRDHKRALVESRVNRRLEPLGINSYPEYLDFLQRDESGQELVQLIDAISTNVTRFFREDDHFEFLDKVVREWAAEGRKNLRFWSAGCSSGEEPYTLAMTLQPHMAANDLDLKILATDINTKVLTHARTGCFSEDRISSVPDELRSRFFTRDSATEDNQFEASEELKRMIMFHRLNLNVLPYPIKGSFDVIMCRNTMIYFDRPLRTRIIDEFARLLKPGGYLLIGHAETLIGIETGYRTIRPSVYQRKCIGDDS
ncbi:MAG: methyltransferase domain-containing protein [Gemmatimonadales bacterium]|nr:methyltransferase domain-containing protein [Gemmatimonadales bacterium]